MRLKQITFTGIDERTNIKALQEIQKEYPIVEWGVLASHHWQENGNRFPSPEMMNKLLGRGLNLSLHLCGKAAFEGADGRWDSISMLTGFMLHAFRRVQLNIAEREVQPHHCCLPKFIEQEIIIQQRNVKEIDLYRRTIVFNPYNGYFSVLLDASGGRGTDTPIEVLETKNHVGYAGGISPDNVEEKLSYLIDEKRTAWIKKQMSEGSWVEIFKTPDDVKEQQHRELIPA